MTPQTKSRLFVIAPLLAALALGLSACGRRGPLDIPDGGATKPAEQNTNIYSPTRQSDKPKAVVPSKEPFLLDPIL
ncbi:MULTISPECIES: lipoprotein [unclassified Beijerinckia]|uniref:LPS translocon maturation chaperone LptM n=1 Tax=unclassified Beijerinckia TaxID=2638183 RepID=UPI00089BB6DA|nr:MULTISPECIES: lipoprotein [unclassified Beijerinckia]MDH7798072.1 putative small lipoprotein YifL [Beijerinckia sp. GAS462]SED08036.1 lipoprotein-attachment site-containing protein [Beijerinckia sp. 28-YEA-48]